MEEKKVEETKIKKTTAKKVDSVKKTDSANKTSSTKKTDSVKTTISAKKTKTKETKKKDVEIKEEAKEIKVVENQTAVEPEGRDINIWKLIAMTAVKTVVALLIGFFYLLIILYYVSPITAIKINSYIGIKGIETNCYERIYNKSGKTTDLYNLIEVSIKNSDNNRVVKYIDIMKESNGYIEFCEKVNNAAISKTDIKRIAYVGEYDS